MTEDERMTATLVQHLVTDNDTNGNPRRVWAVYGPSGSIVDVIDEGYGNLPSAYRDLPQLPTVSVTPAEYREQLSRAEHIHGRFEVVEPAHTGHSGMAIEEYVWHRFETRARANAYRRGHHLDTLVIRDREVQS